MHKISDSNSLFQICFGINVVATALSRKYKLSIASIVQAVEEKIKTHLPGFTVAHSDKDVFKDFVCKSSAAAKHARILKLFPFLLAVMNSSSALFLLTLSAIYPDLEIATGSLVMYFVVSLAMSPLIYFVYQRFLRWLPVAVTNNTLKTTEDAKLAVANFNIFKDLADSITKMEKII